MTNPEPGPEPGAEAGPEPEDEGYLSLVRHLYWSQEAGARPQAGTRQVREQISVASPGQSRRSERLLVHRRRRHRVDPPGHRIRCCRNDRVVRRAPRLR